MKPLFRDILAAQPDLGNALRLFEPINEAQDRVWRNRMTLSCLLAYIVEFSVGKVIGRLHADTRLDAADFSFIALSVQRQQEAMLCEKVHFSPFAAFWH